jgi:hypothetical protein
MRRSRLAPHIRTRMAFVYLPGPSASRVLPRGQDVADPHFGALVEDLVKTLDKFKVAEREKNELLGILGPMKSDIVMR